MSPLSQYKILSVGANALATGAICYLQRASLSARALSSLVGGILVSSGLQTYYVDYHDKLQEKLGSTLSGVVTWICPCLVLLAGYLGGVANAVNLFAIQLFFPLHGLLMWAARASIQDNLKRQIHDLAIQASRNIDKNSLEAAAQALEQADRLKEKLSVPPDYMLLTFAKGESEKGRLIEAYLKLDPPNIEEAEKWALTLSNATIKIGALLSLGSMFLQKEKGAAAEEKILEYIRACEGLNSSYSLPQLLCFKYRFAAAYEKPELIEEVEALIETLNPNQSHIQALFDVAKEGLKHGNHAFVKKCILKEEALIKEYTHKLFAYPFSSDYHSLWSEDMKKPFIKLVIFARKLFEKSKDQTSGLMGGLTQLAIAINELDIAKRFLKSGKVEQEDLLSSLLSLANAQSKTSVETSRKTVTQALGVVDANSASDTAGQARLAILEGQMQFDLEGARQTAHRMTDSKEEALRLIAEQASESDSLISRFFQLFT